MGRITMIQANGAFLMDRTPDPGALPMRALVMALVLAAPVAAFLTGVARVTLLEPVVWVSVLLPVLLLAYYRGWTSIIQGLAFAIFGLSTAQVYLIVAGARLPDWPYVLAVTGAVVLISVLAERFAGAE